MTVNSGVLRFCSILILLAASNAPAQLRRPRATPAPAGRPVAATASQPLRKATELIRKQDPISINQELLAQLASDSSQVLVSLSKQRAYLMMADNVVIDSPISSGKRGRSSPSGKFTILEKDKSHHSNLYGDFVDSKGRVVRAGVSARVDSAPSGTRFRGSPMKWFMRLTGDGVGMHVGILPGYPASHGCIRMPSQAAELFYRHVKIGTPVEVLP
jgi:hypothetical protein